MIWSVFHGHSENVVLGIVNEHAHARALAEARERFGWVVDKSGQVVERTITIRPGVTQRVRP